MNWHERVGRKLKLRDLHTLQVVSTVGSMAKASHELGLSQPAISKAIAEMEQALGVPLLERSSTGVEITPYGSLLVDRVRVIFDEVRQGVEDIRLLADPAQGEVRIGTTEALTVLLADIIDRLTGKYPRVTFHVSVSDTTTLMRELREREIDIVVTRWNARNAADDVLADVFYDAPLAVLAHRRHPLVREKSLELSDLRNERWTLSPPDSFLGRMVGDAFRRHRVDLPKSAVTSLSIYMRLTLLASGRFITMLPNSILQHPTDKTWLRELPVRINDASGRIAAITLKQRRARGTVELFRQACREMSSTVAVDYGMALPEIGSSQQKK